LGSKPEKERVESLAAAASSPTTAIELMTKQTARIVFFLSASNWPLVLSRIKARVAHLTTTLEENPELFELRLLGWANVDSSRLAQVLQEISSPFLHVKRPAQPALASALRMAIWNWIDVYPTEYYALIEGNRKLDGSPDVLFDVLQSMGDSSSTTKRAKVFYPLMVMLLVLSPDMMKRIALGESGRSGSALAKKLSFMDSLRKGLSQSKSFEACAVCYLDLVRAAMCCSPRLDASGIRSLVPDFQNELTNALFYSSLAPEITDTNVLVDGLVALYRANPSGTSSLIFPKLWSDAANDSSKIIGVRACTAIVTEGQRLPWHQPPSGFRSEVAASVRGILKAQTPAVVNGAGNSRGHRRG
jgi:neurofibromin 1